MAEIVEHQSKENPVAILRRQMDSMEGQFKAALPAHIPVERFSRVLMTAIQNNPDLLHADRQSLWNAAMKAAQDGLLPDGREGAIVIYKSKEKVRQADGTFVDKWILKAQWMPMVQGVMKKARNSGEIASIGAGVVYGGDSFRHWIDDTGEHLLYESCDNPDMETVRRIFAFAKLKDGSLVVETLAPSEVEKIRSVSRAKDSGPWVSWWSEMAKKSAIRRLSKRLPMSTDLDDLIRRDDSLYDFDNAREQAAGKQGLAGKLDVLAAMPSKPPAQPARGAPIENHTKDHVEDDAGNVVKDRATAAEAEAEPTADKPKEAAGSAEPVAEIPPSAGSGSSSADQEGAASSSPTGEAATPTKPPTSDAALQKWGEAGYKAWAMGWIASTSDPAGLHNQWKAEKAIRNKANVSGEVRNELERLMEQRAIALKGDQ